MCCFVYMWFNYCHLCQENVYIPSAFTSDISSKKVHTCDGKVPFDDHMDCLSAVHTPSSSSEKKCSDILVWFLFEVESSAFSDLFGYIARNCWFSKALTKSLQNEFVAIPLSLHVIQNILPSSIPGELFEPRLTTFWADGVVVVVSLDIPGID